MVNSLTKLSSSIIKLRPSEKLTMKLKTTFSPFRCPQLQILLITQSTQWTGKLINSTNSKTINGISKRRSRAEQFPQDQNKAMFILYKLMH